MKHQLSIRPINEFSKKYSENRSLENFKPIPYSYRVESMNLHRKSIECFYFRIALTADELSITNHEVHGFSNSFQHSEN